MTTDLTNDLPNRLRTMSDMIHLGERIAWGSDSAIMDEAADALEAAMRENEELKLSPLKLICEKCNVLTDVNHDQPTEDRNGKV